MPSERFVPGNLGCPLRGNAAKQRALDAHKLIAVLRRMEQEWFCVSAKEDASKFIFRRILGVFGLNEGTVESIVTLSVKPGQTAQYLVLPRTLGVADFDLISAHQDGFYQRLAAFRKGINSHQKELAREIAEIHGIMDSVLGVAAPEKKGRGR